MAKYMNRKNALAKAVKHYFFLAKPLKKVPADLAGVRGMIVFSKPILDISKSQCKAVLVNFARDVFKFEGIAARPKFEFEDSPDGMLFRFEAGKKPYIEMRLRGTEDNPEVRIAW